MQMTLPAGSSLSRSIELSNEVEQILMENFPEIRHVVAKIGTAEVPTDPMAVEDGDIMIIMKPFSEWTSAKTRAEMVDKMKAALAHLEEEAEFNFSQPIQLRFNELMTGAKADIAIKLYGEDMEELYEKAKEAAAFVEQVPGAADVLVEQAMGLPQLVVKYDRAKVARYGMNIDELNTIIRTAYAGEVAGVVFENERRFDLVVRLDNRKVPELNLDKLFVRTGEGVQIPVSEVATIDLVIGPLQINRDETKRRIVIGVNVREGDIQQVVSQIQTTLEKNIQLKPGYYFEYGGQFENLQNAIDTLTVVIPVALLLILLILFFAFKSVTYTLVVFLTVPLSLIGGILALWLRGLPFSISAGVGFIALFGVAVLNGILMINHFNELRNRNTYRMTTNRIIAKGCPHLLRPVFLTGLVASLGFVPMAIATSAGAEVQRPLATVVIGGLLVSTILTLIIIPIFYRLVNSSYAWKRVISRSKTLVIILLAGVGATVNAQQAVTMEQAIELALANHPRLKTATASIERTRVSRGEVWGIPSTDFSYSWGQLNSEVKDDNEWNINQSLGSLLTPFYKNALISRQVATGEYYRRMVEKEIIAEVRRSWANYIYTVHQLQLYRQQNEMARKLQQAGQLRYEQGDITLLERNMATALAADITTRLIRTEEELRISSRRLAWACYSDELLVPADTALTIFPADYSSHLPSESHLNYFQSQANEKSVLVNIERSKFFPEISLGYSRQKIAPLTGLNSWMVGFSFPLIFAPQRSRIKQAKYDYYIAQIEVEANGRELANKVGELQAQLRQHAETIRYYTTGALPEADALMESATLQFYESDTDILQFVQSFTTARDIRLGYIEAVYQYNIAVLELELYTESR